MQIENNKSDILNAYVSDRRNLDIPNYRREDLGCIVRYTPNRPDADGIICFTNIEEDALDREIEFQSSYFNAKEANFEWKVYDFDEPQILRERLLKLGFEEGDTESLMVCDLSNCGISSEQDVEGIEIQEISTARDLEQIVRIQESVWDRSFPWLLEQPISTIDRTTYFCAYDQDSPIGAGWIEYPKESLFAEIHGGSVYPEYRSRGIYSLLFGARVNDAKEKGVPYIAVDAAPMSRPILESKGFKQLCRTYPLTKRFAYQDSSDNADQPRV